MCVRLSLSAALCSGHHDSMNGHAGLHAPSPAMAARIAVGLVAVAAFESVGAVDMPWVWAPVLAAAVLLVWSGERLCRRHLPGGPPDDVWRPADVLAAAVAAMPLFTIAVLLSAPSPGGLSPPGIMAAVLIGHALPDRLTRSWARLSLSQRTLTLAVLALPAALVLAAAALERTQLADAAAMAAGILVMTLIIAVAPNETQRPQQHKSSVQT